MWKGNVANSSDGAKFAKPMLAVITVGLALIVALFTSAEISASEWNDANGQVRSMPQGKQTGDSAFSQELVVEAHITVGTGSELQLIEDMGLPCEELGPCHLEMNHQDLMILQEAQIPVNVTARALKITLDDSPKLVTESDTYQYASRYDNLVIDDWDEASYNVSISGAPSWAVVTDVRYSARIEHSYPGELWLQLAWNEPDVLIQIWSALGGADDGGYDDDPEYDDDIELINRSLSDFNGVSVNETWGILAEDFTVSGNSGWFDYFELYIYYVLNDDFDHAFEINILPYFNSQDYDGATRAPDDPDPGCDDVGGTVWYRYTAPQDELVRFQIGGIGGEWLAIFTGARGNLTEVACDRGSGSDGWWSRVDLAVTGGTTYHIMIGPDDSYEAYMEIEAYRLESNCDTIVDIPQSECAALKAFYEQMSDTGDIESTWFKSDTACSWYGITCSGGHITELSLLLSHLNGKIVPELEDLTRLRVLELGSNEYWSGGIPPELGNLSNLEVLDLGSNYLLDGPIPPELGNLENLVILNLEQNDLTGSVPSELGNLSNLRELYLDWTFLSGGLPQSLTDLDLFVFWFHDTDLCEPGDAAFQNWLQGINDLSRTGVTCSIVAPTLFEVSNSDGDGNYTISWSNVSSADSYQLQEQHDGGSWTTIYNNSGTSVNRTGRSDGEWCYRVRASNAGGVSNWSNVECTTVDATPTPPDAPVLNSISNSDGDGNYTVSWSGETGATSYELQEQFNGGGWSTIYNDSATSVTRSGRTDGQWCYRVRASNAGGTSDWAAPVCTTVNTTPPPAAEKTSYLPVVLNNAHSYPPVEVYEQITARDGVVAVPLSEGGTATFRIVDRLHQPIEGGD